MDIKIFANHNIDFSNNTTENTAIIIKELLDNTIIVNRLKLQNLIRDYYNSPGYEDIRKNWQETIDNWISDKWDYYIDNNWESNIRIDFLGPFKLRINFTNNYIEFSDPGFRYYLYFGMDKKIRDEWRKYYYQFISLFGGNYALYLPDQGEVGTEFTEKIWDHNLNLNNVINDLIKKYGNNTINIDDFPFDDKGFVDPPFYYIDYFEDIKKRSNSYRTTDLG